MKVGNYRYHVDWMHLIVVTVVMGLIIAYLLDARAESLQLSNLIFIQPLAIAAFLLYLLILPQTVKRQPIAPRPGRKAALPEDAPARRESLSEIAKIAMLVLAFGLFVFGVERFGFDICSWAFFTVALLICGERNPIALVVFPPVATVAFFWGFRALVPYPMPTLFL